MPLAHTCDRWLHEQLAVPSPIVAWDAYLGDTLQHVLKGRAWGDAATLAIMVTMLLDLFGVSVHVHVWHHQGAAYDWVAAPHEYYMDTSINASWRLQEHVLHVSFTGNHYLQVISSSEAWEAARSIDASTPADAADDGGADSPRAMAGGHGGHKRSSGFRKRQRMREQKAAAAKMTRLAAITEEASVAAEAERDVRQLGMAVAQEAAAVAASRAEPRVDSVEAAATESQVEMVLEESRNLAALASVWGPTEHPGAPPQGGSITCQTPNRSLNRDLSAVSRALWAGFEQRRWRTETPENALEDTSKIEQNIAHRKRIHGTSLRASSQGQFWSTMAPNGLVEGALERVLRVF